MRALAGSAARSRTLRCARSAPRPPSPRPSLARCSVPFGRVTEAEPRPYNRGGGAIRHAFPRHDPRCVHRRARFGRAGPGRGERLGGGGGSRGGAGRDGRRALDGTPEVRAARRPPDLGQRHGPRAGGPVPRPRRRGCRRLRRLRRRDEAAARHGRGARGPCRGAQGRRAPRERGAAHLRRGLRRPDRGRGGAGRPEQRQRVERPQRRLAARRGGRARCRGQRAGEPAVGRRPRVRGGRSPRGSTRCSTRSSASPSETREAVGSGLPREPIPAPARA